jgi:hypothetical protein
MVWWLFVVGVKDLRRGYGKAQTTLFVDSSQHTRRFSLFAPKTNTEAHNVTLAGLRSRSQIAVAPGDDGTDR